MGLSEKVFARDVLWSLRHDEAKSKMNNDNLVGHYLFNTWQQVFQRCYNPFNNSFPLYGARGIEVCERWFSFRNFIDDMGDRPEGCSIDRKDPYGDYSPDNCRWASRRMQAKNMRPEKRKEARETHNYHMHSHRAPNFEHLFGAKFNLH